jgi:hypothetical protein
MVGHGTEPGFRRSAGPTGNAAPAVMVSTADGCDAPITSARPPCDTARRCDRTAFRLFDLHRRRMWDIRLRLPPRGACDICYVAETLSYMRALTLVGDRKPDLVDLRVPPGARSGRRADSRQGGRSQPPRPVGRPRHGVRQVQGAAAARGGNRVTSFLAGDPVVIYGALTRNTCKACRDAATIFARMPAVSWPSTWTASPAMSSPCGAAGHQGAGGHRDPRPHLRTDCFGHRRTRLSTTQSLCPACPAR